MAENIQCRRCYHLRNDWCKIKRDSPDQELVRTCLYYSEATNADKLRAGDNKYIAGVVCTGCPPGIETGKQCTGDGACYDCWLNWLKSPAGGDTE